MATASPWSAFHSAHPEFAKAVEERFGGFRHHILATLRADGSPRVTGIEADFRFGELWLGMMVNSRKARDLLRDPRFSLYANPGPGTDMAGGDIRISGTAAEETDPATLTRYIGAAAPPLPFHLFRTEITEVVRTRVEGPDMVVEVWRPEQAVRTIRRGNGDEPPREDR